MGDFIDDTCATLDSLKDVEHHGQGDVESAGAYRGRRHRRSRCMSFHEEVLLVCTVPPIFESNDVHMRGGGTRAKGALESLITVEGLWRTPPLHASLSQKP